MDLRTFREHRAYYLVARSTFSKIESGVKNVKNMLKRISRDHIEQCLALQEMRKILCSDVNRSLSKIVLDGNVLAGHFKSAVIFPTIGLKRRPVAGAQPGGGICLARKFQKLHSNFGICGNFQRIKE